MEDEPTRAISGHESENQLSAEQAQLPAPRGTEKIFVDSLGVRWIWRLAVYLVLRKLLYWILLAGVSSAQDAGLRYAWITVLSEASFLVVAVIPALLMARVEDRPFDAYGMPPRQAFGKLFWVGGLWGLAAISILMLALRGAGALDFSRLALHGERALDFAVFWGVFFLLVGLSEEFYPRGYALFTLSEGIGFWPAAAVLSIVFAAMHLQNQGENPGGVAAAGVIGFFFCLTLRRTGTLWFAVGFHTAWDWGESYLYSVPDSGMLVPGHLLKSNLHGPAWLTGGSAGPEGSLLTFVLIALLWAVFDRVYREARWKGPASFPAPSTPPVPPAAGPP